MSDYIYALSDKEYLSTFITGHLGAEFIIDKLILTKISDNSIYDKLRLRFEQKILLLKGFNLITDDELSLLKEINKIRNIVRLANRERNKRNSTIIGSCKSIYNEKMYKHVHVDYVSIPNPNLGDIADCVFYSLYETLKSNI